MNSITCHVCQTQNPSDNKFCTQCGTRVQGITHIICSVCYHRNALSLTFCDNCGSELQHTKSTSDEVVIDFESGPTASDIKTGLLFAADDEEGESTPEWFESEEGVSKPEVVEPVAQESVDESALDVDWLSALDIERVSSDIDTSRDTSPPEITDWLAELSHLDEFDATDEEKSFTDELFMSDEVEPVSSVIDDVSSVEADQAHIIPPDDSLSMPTDINQQDLLVDLGAKLGVDEDSTGLTDWLSEIEETAQDNTDIDESSSKSEPVIDELPNWFSLDDDSEPNTESMSSATEENATDDWLRQEPAKDELDASLEGVTSWLNDLSEQTMEDETVEGWDNAEVEETEPATPKFPTWLLDDEDLDSTDNIDKAKTGFTDWLAPIEGDEEGSDAQENVEVDSAQNEFSWLTDDGGSEPSSFGESEMADWLVNDVDTEIDSPNAEEGDLEGPLSESIDLESSTLLQIEELPDLVSDEEPNEAFEWLLDDDPLAGLDLIAEEDDVSSSDETNNDLVSDASESDVIDQELDNIEWLVDTADSTAVDSLDDDESLLVIDPSLFDDAVAQNLFGDVEDLLSEATGDDNDLLLSTDDNNLDQALVAFDNELARFDEGGFDTESDDFVDDMSFDDWLAGDEDLLDESNDDLEFPIDPEQSNSADSENSLAPVGTGFTSWLSSDSLPEINDEPTSEFEASEAESVLDNPPQQDDVDGRTGFTGWLTAEEEAEDDDFSTTDSSGAVIPDWLKDSDELPDLAESDSPEDDVVLGEGNGGQSFSDWLKDSGVEVEEEVEEEDLLSDSEPTGFTQWLTDPTSEPLDLSVLEESGDDDWLENIIPDDDGSSDEVVADMPDWLTAAPAVTSSLEDIDAIDDQQDEELPEWMLNMGTGELDPTVLGNQIDELLESGDPEWIAELESGPLHSDRLPELDPSLHPGLDDLEDESSEPDIWSDSTDNEDLFDDFLHTSEGPSDQGIDDDAWLASLNLDDATDIELDFDADADDVSTESDEIAVNAELPAWLVAAMPDDSSEKDDPDSFSFEAAEGDLFAGTADQKVNTDFLNKLSAFDDEDEGELDLSAVTSDWTEENEVVFDHQDLSDDQLATADVPAWLQPEDDGLAKANVPDWLQNEPSDLENIPDEEMLIAQEMGGTSSAIGLNALSRAVPIAPAINQFVAMQVQDSIVSNKVIHERQATKADSWADIVKHDVVSTMSTAPKAPNVKAKRPPKAQMAQMVDDQPKKRSRYRTLMWFLLLVLFVYFLWLFQPEIMKDILARIEALWSSLNIDLSTIVP